MSAYDLFYRMFSSKARPKFIIQRHRNNIFPVEVTLFKQGPNKRYNTRNLFKPNIPKNKCKDSRNLRK